MGRVDGGVEKEPSEKEVQEAATFLTEALKSSRYNSGQGDLEVLRQLLSMNAACTSSSTSSSTSSVLHRNDLS